jgi:hypothetical protein
VIPTGPRKQQDRKSWSAWYNASERAARSSGRGFLFRKRIPTVQRQVVQRTGTESMMGEMDSRALTAGGKRVISYNIESTLLSAAAPFNGMDCVKQYKEDKSAAMPRVVWGILGCHEESTR